MRKSIISIAFLIILTPFLLGNGGCDSTIDTKSSSGVQKASVQVRTGADGLTVEQRNVKERLAEDNKPGSIKHLYVISAYSGQVLIYSTVRGKVTSGGKRLTPTSVVVGTQGEYKRPGFAVNFGGTEMATGEVLQDDGAYGHSMDYLYWWDTKGVYHQHYVAGGQILHVSSQPLAVKSIVINMEITQKQE
ncbi:MAG: hypothetical protein Q7R61_00130 [bacterium]|nr:hypothetical protein [bacterium]